MRRMHRLFYCFILITLTSIVIFLTSQIINHKPDTALASPDSQAVILQPTVVGPFTPTRYDGSLMDLPVVGNNPAGDREIPKPVFPEKLLPGSSVDFIDPLAQTTVGAGQMPEPIMNFPGLIKSDAGGWIPPDTNGDVGPNHYIQVVNIGIGIYDKDTGTELVNLPYTTFFQNAPPPCNNQNRGDVIVLYDQMADRWLVSDFSLPTGGPFYECIAISQSGDPVNGGWYFYAFQIQNPYGSWNDYPKLSVWPDAYYMSANMFDPWSGPQVWAMDRAKMLQGLPFSAVYFLPGTQYGSLLPSNLRGPLPPAGSPAFFASFDFPNIFHLWRFHVDWVNPPSSTFTGPINLTVADFSPIWEISQPGTGQTLDSLGDRLMMQLQYRNYGTHEALFVNHTVSSAGVAGVRWYEVRDPAGAPLVYQQGTYQPDQDSRWMGSIAADQDGNIALGYSVSSDQTKPGIRYAGRLNGEILGALPQAEVSLIEGTGVQTGSNRWGDYSAMTIDPVDDCTFWYTNEYHLVNGSNWVTQIGSFKFPSCGQPKGTISGIVFDGATSAYLPDVPVRAEGITTTLTTLTDSSGNYSINLPGGVYTLTAGPLPPGYPYPAIFTDIPVTPGMTTPLDLDLHPYPVLVHHGERVDDTAAGGNGNGFTEPGENNIQLWESITDIGPASAVGLSAHLVALTPGVSISSSDSTYADISSGQTLENDTPFIFSIAPTVTCGTQLDFMNLITTGQGVFTLTFSLQAAVPLPRASFFNDNMENGQDGWTTGGVRNTWALTTGSYHSPTHSWTDSPSGAYQNDTNSWLRSPIFNLENSWGFELSFWHKYSTEVGFDFGFVEYSTNGGTTWHNLSQYTGAHPLWSQEKFSLPEIDDQSNVYIRYRLNTDPGVTADGWYIDDVNLTYIPVECTPIISVPAVPTLLSPPSGTITSTHEITFSWLAAIGPQPDGYEININDSVYTTTATSYSTILEQGFYSWQVRAYNTSGYSAFSDLWSFEVLDKPGLPVLLTPEDGSFSISPVLFEWMASPSGGTPDGYIFLLDNTPVMTFTSPITTTQMQLDSGYHNWSVAATNASGSSGFAPKWELHVGYLNFIPVIYKH